ncbi:hypothetical protein [Leuconostoc mesenteroides]|uniref:hypothetical protein n=1 Tax=Leuconostoc mesenteroides TaxID=1245 RepID=UPI0023623192|nr:hypothetical protein [Leuconostoc mesenteroides]
MRFPDNIQFYSNVKEHYDPKVGDYVGGPELVGEAIANVTETAQKQACRTSATSPPKILLYGL